MDLAELEELKLELKGSLNIPEERWWRGASTLKDWIGANSSEIGTFHEVGEESDDYRFHEQEQYS